MIATALTDLLAVRVPIINAPMTPQAGGRLARAVSEAGAFGMVGIEEIDTEEGIAEQLAIVTAGPRVPFGIGLVAWVIERRPELLEIAIAAKPNLISISFGDVGPFVPRLREAGILVASQVQSRHWAEVALKAEVDVLVAQGTEAGGHTGSVGTLPLLQIVLELTDRPVVAAGGIASGRGLAAVVAAGAAGAWIGTPFLLAEEALNSSRARVRIVEADETETLYTSVYDRLQDKSWPAEFRARALRNPFGAKWTGHEEQLVAGTEPRLAFEQARAAEDYDIAHVYAGQSVGLLSTIQPAGTIVSNIEMQARELLTAVGGTVSSPSP
jgi:nitronate monooxygenase